MSAISADIFFIFEAKTKYFTLFLQNNGFALIFALYNRNC